MFSTLVSDFQKIVSEKGFCTARLYVDGLATQVTVTYLRNGDMEIKGLPDELPRYLLFQGDKVYLDSKKTRPVQDEEEASFYRLYRTWDPRVVVSSLDSETPVMEGQWAASYNIEKLEKAISLHSDIKNQLERFLKQGPEIEFVTDGHRLLELSERDFSRYPTRLTLIFEYPDGRREIIKEIS